MYTFKGKSNEFIQGVPNRDLSEAEFKALPPELQKAVDGSDLYQKAGASVSTVTPSKTNKEK